MKCVIKGNPLPSLTDVEWSIIDLDEKQKDKQNILKAKTVSTKDNSIETSLTIIQSEIVPSHQPHAEMQLKVRNPLEKSQSSFLTKVIKIDAIKGPDIACPSRKRVDFGGSGGGGGRGEGALIACDVYVNPLPPLPNVSWFIDDNFVGKQKKSFSHKIQGGIRYEFPLSEGGSGLGSGNSGSGSGNSGSGSGILPRIRSGMKVTLSVEGVSSKARKEMRVFNSGSGLSMTTTEMAS